MIGEELAEPRPCPVCGIPAIDGKHDQVALWGWGVHHAEARYDLITDKPFYEMVILHPHCVTQYIQGKFIECQIEARKR